MDAPRPAAALPTASGKRTRKRVAVIEDDPEMRLFMRQILDESPGLRCCGTYASAEQALGALTLRAPHLVLVDIRLPGISGLECLRRLKATFPRLPVVVVTGVQQLHLIKEASLAGCDAYLEKPFLVHQFLATVRFCLPRRRLARYAEPEPSEQTAAGEAFTLREEQVMRCLCQGLLYKEIAGELGVSFSMVHKVQNRVFHKLQARNRTEAVNIWQALARREK